MNKKVKFKINLFHLLDDLGGWEYFDQIVEDKMDNEYMSEGGYTLLSPLDKDELMVMIDELNSRLIGKGLGFRVRMEVYYENSTNQ